MRADDRAAGANQGLEVRLDASEFYMIARAARDTDKRLYANMRKELRAAGDEFVALVRTEIGRIPSSGKRRTGVRAALQKGTRASISVASARTAGVRIVTSPRFLPESKRPMAKAFNLETFRHPVFPDPDRPRSLASRRAGARAAMAGGRVAGAGESWTWVQQSGRPYFGAAIFRNQDVAMARLRTALARTIDQTATEIARTKGRIP